MIDLGVYLGEGVDARFTEREEGSFALPSGDADPLGRAHRDVLYREGIDADRVVTIRQIHGARVFAAEDLGDCAEQIPEADGVITRRTDVVLSVRTADCVPVFLYDPVRRSIGLIHCGWKSTRQKIITETLKGLYQNFQAYPSDLRVVFGPSIRSCCYQVGQEFCEILPEAMEPRYGQWFLNLQAVIAGQLMDFGVREEQIHDVQRCTCCDAGFFSWRREGETAGRHLSVMRLHEK